VILIKNIYYMLSYAYQVLKEQDIKEVGVESFDNVQKLCAEILIRSFSVQIKRGLGGDYIPYTETLSSVKGKISVSDSIKTQSIIRRQLVCTYDEFSTNTKLNQIIKTTLLLLLRSDITAGQKKEIRKLLVYLDDVDQIDVHTIDWNLNYNRNNQSYHLIISICYLVIKGLLQTQSDGSVKLMHFLDEQRMCRLYEKFIREYYKKEFKQIKVSASQIPWAEDNDFRDMLPVMQSDVMLEHKDKVLIIDAKYYAHTLQTQYDAQTIHSNNLYQIFTYVKNKTADSKLPPENVSGMLLYARTDEMIQPNQEYHLSGNTIVVKTLDLNQDFKEIKDSLDRIASMYLLH